MHQVIFFQIYARSSQKGLGAPGFRRNRELKDQVEVPVDKVRLDLDMLFLVLPRLHLFHLGEGHGHQDVSEHGSVEESHFSDADEGR